MNESNKNHRTTGLQRASELSISAFDSIDAAVDDYTIIRAERQLPYRRWAITYKRSALIPAKDDAEIGKGGEVFVIVDLAAGTATVSGYGE